MNAKSMQIIGLAPNPWHGQWMNRQQLLSRLAPRHRVVYSTGAWTVWDRKSPEWNASSWRGRTEFSDGVLVEHAPKFLLRWPSRKSLDRLVVNLHASRLQRLLGPQRQGPTVAMLFHPDLSSYATALQADVVAYHAYDLFEATPGWTVEQQRAEDALIKAASLITTVSSAIAERLEQRTGRAVRVLPNGVDVNLFSKPSDAVEIPDDLSRIPRPRLGYVGSIHPQINFGLAAQIAKSRPDWNLVIVGGDPGVRTPELEGELSECRSLPNVHFLGAKQYTEVPRYAMHMDVNLMLYRLAPAFWSVYCYPLKLHEYLATGKPVVSVDLPAVREFRQVVRIVERDDDWVMAIEAALQGRGAGTPAERSAVASENTWDRRVDGLEQWLEEAAIGASIKLAPAAG